MSIKPRLQAPSLEFDIVGGGRWRLGAVEPDIFDMIVVYRGLHCPQCKAYLGDLEAKLADFSQRGVAIVAVSVDTRERAERTKVEWGLNHLCLGYGLTLACARDWELFVSRAIRDGEPPEFVEPGLFLVKPDGSLFFASRGNAPWGRPLLDQVLRGIDTAIERKSLARGEA